MVKKIADNVTLVYSFQLAFLLSANETSKRQPHGHLKIVSECAQQFMGIKVLLER